MRRGLFMEYAYPDNLKARPTLWLWELRHIAFIGAGLLLSVLAFAQLGTLVPFVVLAVFAFVTIRMEEMTILNYLCFSVRFFLIGQQLFFWR